MKHIYLLIFFVISTSSLWAQTDINIELISHTSLGAIANDVWGYVDSSGREYAIVGTRPNTQIYLLNDSLPPKLIKTIDGFNSIWRDYKSFGTYVYAVADQGKEGLTIIDMSMAPDSISYQRWTDTIYTSQVPVLLEKCHNLYIDTSGFAYLSGCNPGNGGIIILDLRISPNDPTIVGVEDEAYAHDVVTYQNKMFTSEIYEGNLGIYDITHLDMPLFLARQNTSSSFTHNAWPSDDGQFIFTTDERGRGFVDAYDISDIDNIRLLDKYRPNDQESVLPHNTHYQNGFLVTSWYSEGLIVIDAHRPHNLIRVGQYDTNPQNANGNWGAYPFLPSGNILATDMENGLYVLKPHYMQAAYLEGKVINKDTQKPINGASIQLVTKSPTFEVSNADGSYATGIALSGLVTVIVSHPEYTPDTVQLILVESKLLEYNFEMEQKSKFKITGQVLDLSGAAISDANLILVGNETTLESASNEFGMFEITAIQDIYDIYVAKWGFLHKSFSSVVVDQNTDLTAQLEQGYQDDFFSDLGWTVTGDALRGQWIRDIPKGTFFGSQLSNPDQDVNDDLGPFCYVTGNNNSAVGTDDVDDGSTILNSPEIDISNYQDPFIEFKYWFFNDGGAGTPNDQLNISIMDSNNVYQVMTIKDTFVISEWRPIRFRIKDFTNATKLRLIIEASDDKAQGHLVEAGIDAFKILDEGSTTSNTEITNDKIVLWPNPALDFITIDLPKDYKYSQIRIVDIMGRVICQNVTEPRLFSLLNIKGGLYFVQLRADNGSKLTLPFTKISIR